MSASPKRAFASIPGRDYASETDFCQVFNEQMNRLYTLSLLLTGEQQRAEQCFVESFEECFQSIRVFKDWAPRWATHTIIKNAIQMMLPMQGSASVRAIANQNRVSEPEILRETLLDLPIFDRFAYVMSVLENYSDRECAAFLGCAPTLIPIARQRAIQVLGETSAPLLRQEVPAPAALRMIS